MESGGAKVEEIITEPLEFETLLKQKYLSQYSSETDCLGNCFSCSEAK